MPRKALKRKDIVDIVHCATDIFCLKGQTDSCFVTISANTLLQRTDSATMDRIRGHLFSAIWEVRPLLTISGAWKVTCRQPESQLGHLNFYWIIKMRTRIKRIVVFRKTICLDFAILQRLGVHGKVPMGLPNVTLARRTKKDVVSKFVREGKFNVKNCRQLFCQLWFGNRHTAMRIVRDFPILCCKVVSNVADWLQIFN